MLQHVPDWTCVHNIPGLTASSHRANTEMPLLCLLWTDAVWHTHRAWPGTFHLKLWVEQLKTKKSALLISGKTCSSPVVLTKQRKSLILFKFAECFTPWNCKDIKIDKYVQIRWHGKDFVLSNLRWNYFITNLHALRESGVVEGSPSLQIKWMRHKTIWKCYFNVAWYDMVTRFTKTSNVTSLTWWKNSYVRKKYSCKEELQLLSVN